MVFLQLGNNFFFFHRMKIHISVLTLKVFIVQSPCFVYLFGWYPEIKYMQNEENIYDM
jgi:hypothetical protein